MLFFIKKLPKIHYSCRFAGFSKPLTFLLCLILRILSLAYLRLSSFSLSFQQLLQYFLRFDVCLINLLFHNIENAEFLLKKFSKSTIYAGLRDFLNCLNFIFLIIPFIYSYSQFTFSFLPITLAIFSTV
jgi:hypothetical protein